MVEALTNEARHAEATAARVVLRRGDNLLVEGMTFRLPRGGLVGVMDRLGVCGGRPFQEVTPRDIAPDEAPAVLFDRLASAVVHAHLDLRDAAGGGTGGRAVLASVRSHFPLVHPHLHDRLGFGPGTPLGLIPVRWLSLARGCSGAPVDRFGARRPGLASVGRGQPRSDGT